MLGAGTLSELFRFRAQASFSGEGGLIPVSRDKAALQADQAHQAQKISQQDLLQRFQASLDPSNSHHAVKVQNLKNLSTETSSLIFAQDLLEFLLETPSSSPFSGQVPALLQQLRSFVENFVPQAHSKKEAQALVDRIDDQLSLYQGTASLGAQAGFSLKQLAQQFPNSAMVGGMALSLPLHALSRYALVARGVKLWRANLGAFLVDGMAFTAGEATVHSLQGFHDPRPFGTRLWESYRMLGVMRFTGSAVGTLTRTTWLRHAMANSPLFGKGVSYALPHLSAFTGLSFSEMALHGQSFGGSLLPSALGVLHFAGAKGVLYGLAPKLALRSQQLEQATQQAALNRFLHIRTLIRTQVRTYVSPHPQGQTMGFFNQASALGPSFDSNTSLKSSRGPVIKVKDLNSHMADEGRRRGSDLRYKTRNYQWPPGTIPKSHSAEEAARISRVAAKLPDTFFEKGKIKAAEIYLPAIERRLAKMDDLRIGGSEAANAVFLALAQNASRGEGRPSPKLYENFINLWDILDSSVRVWDPKVGETRRKGSPTRNNRTEVLVALMVLSKNFGGDFYAFGAGAIPVLRGWKKHFGVTARTPEGWKIIRDSLITWSQTSRTHSSRFFLTVPTLLARAKELGATSSQATAWIRTVYFPWIAAAYQGNPHAQTEALAKIEALALATHRPHP